MKFLYGASIKKIQSYISESSKLQEIAGASELVEYICTDLFTSFLQREKVLDADIVIQAAGNIRMVLGSRESAEKVMYRFGRQVIEKAPGVQFIQGIVELSEEKITPSASQQLEDELKKQLPSVSPWKDWSVTLKSAKTGKAAMTLSDGEPLDVGTYAKRAAVNQHWRSLKELFGVKRFPSDIDDIAGIDNFVAVIHADGNSLGKRLMDLNKDGDYDRNWREFSIRLNESTVTAAQRSYRDVCSKTNQFRPIILGGDDLTVICSAELALPFTEKYLQYFEEETGKHAVLGPLTACAGIAFIKKNYPFYYGLELAEMLCAETKKRAKACSEDPVPGSLMFAKEVGGYVDRAFSIMEKRSLTAQLEDSEVSFVFGPYKVTADEPGGDRLPWINALHAGVDALATHTPLRSALRNFISELHVSRDAAKLRIDRAEQIASGKNDGSHALEALKDSLCAMTGNKSDKLYDLLFCSGEKREVSPALDLLTVNQFTEYGKGVKKDV